MYAKQAQHYTGESSLDLENESNQDSSPNSLEKQTNSSNIDNKEVKIMQLHLTTKKLT